MDKNEELLLHIFMLQRDHTVGFRSNQLVGILYGLFCELKYRGFKHDYTFTFKRWGENPTSQEMLEILKSFTTTHYLDRGRNQKQESVYQLGVKGAIAGHKLPPLDPVVQNCLMAWVGYYLPMNGISLDRHLHDKFKLVNFEIGDSLPLINPYASRYTPRNDDWF